MALRASTSSIMAVISVAMLMSACTSTMNRGAVPPPPAPPLQPAPQAQVDSSALPPPGPTPPPANQTAQVSPPAPGTQVPDPSATTQIPEPATQVAKVEPEGQDISRESMAGAWTVSNQSGGSCQIFLTLTKWSGGYRAPTRGCAGTDIKDVQAWDVKGKRVVLVNSSGGTAATLYKSGGNLYNGSTSGGGAISFTR